MYLCVLKKIALEPAPIREVASKCASEVSKSGQRVRLFKFLEGDLYRPITQFDRSPCKDHRDR